MEVIMQKYVIFIKTDESKVIQKESVTSSFIKDMKQKGFRKHHIEVEAENEKEAIIKLNEHSEGYLSSLKDLSGSAVICAVCFGVVALIYIFR